MVKGAVALGHHCGDELCNSCAEGDGDAGLAGCRAHVGHNALKGFEGQAFFKDESATQVAGPRAQHGNVVDGAMHCQTADAAACARVAAAVERWRAFSGFVSEEGLSEDAAAHRGT